VSRVAMCEVRSREKTVKNIEKKSTIISKEKKRNAVQ
jgi:hypothetical protein